MKNTAEDSSAVFLCVQTKQAFPLRSISPDSGGKCPQSGQKGGRFTASEKVPSESEADEVVAERRRADGIRPYGLSPTLSHYTLLISHYSLFHIPLATSSNSTGE